MGGKYVNNYFKYSLTLLSFSLVILSVNAKQPAGQSISSPTPTPINTILSMTYVPPVRGAPTTRTIGAGTRGTRTTQPLSITVLAPNHTGWTNTDQPTLYWHSNQPITHPIEITILAQAAEEPLLDIKMSHIDHAGIHAIDLSTQPVYLQPNIQYQWFVAVVINPQHRSTDVLSNATIQYVPASEHLTRQISHTLPASQPSLYAQAGYWYEAMQVTEQLIQRHPNASNFALLRKQLLEQVALTLAW